MSNQDPLYERAGLNHVSREALNKALSSVRPTEAPVPAQPNSITTVSFKHEYGSPKIKEPLVPSQPPTVVHVPIPRGNESRYVEVLREQSQAAQATPCNCCADLALAAAEFANSTRVDNHEEAKRHRERYIDILIKHATIQVGLTAMTSEAIAPQVESIYCQNCGVMPVIFHRMQADNLNDHDATDIICVNCRSIIATLHHPEGHTHVPQPVASPQRSSDYNDEIWKRGNALSDKAPHLEKEIRELCVLATTHDEDELYARTAGVDIGHEQDVLLPGAVASPGAEEIARQHIDAAFTADDVPAARRVGYAEGFLAARMHIMGTCLVNNTGHHGLHAQSLYCDEWKEDAQPVLEMTPEEERVLKALWVKYAADEHDGISEMYWPQFIKAMRDYAASTEARLAEQEQQWKSWGIVEIAVRNQSVADYIKHWEGRAEAAEARNKELEGENERWMGTVTEAIDRQSAPSLLLREMGETHRWIPVSERLPEYDTDVQIWSEAWGRVYVGYWRHSEEWIGRYRPEETSGLPETGPTHWMPMAQPPSALLTRLSSDTKEEK